MLRGGNGKFSRLPLTGLHARSIPRRLSPEFCIDMTLSRSRGRGEDRVAAAPGALAQKKLRKRESTGTDGYHTGLPRAVV
jgi:hypothetical protein